MTASKLLLACCAGIAATGFGTLANIDRVLAEPTQSTPAMNSIMLSPTNGQSVICFPHDRGGYCVSIFPYSQTQGESAHPQIEIRTPVITESEEPPEIYVNVMMPAPALQPATQPTIHQAIEPVIQPTIHPALQPNSLATPSRGSIFRIDRADELNLEPLW